MSDVPPVEATPEEGSPEPVSESVASEPAVEPVTEAAPEPAAAESPLSEVARLGVDPIPGDSPTGEDPRSDDTFDQLQAEVGKLDSLTDTTVDWKKVVAYATTILKERSKDIRVAAYLAYGEFEQRSYAGLADGLALLVALMKTHWEALYPPKKRMRGRASVVGWMAERAAKRVRALDATAADADAVRACDASFEELWSCSEELLGEHSPAELAELKRALRERVRSLPAEPKSAPTPAAGAGSSAPAARSASGPSVDSPETADDAKRVLRNLRTVLRQCGGLLLAADASDPVSYRVQRFAAWLEMRKAPPNQDGATQIPGVPSAQAETLRGSLRELGPKERIERCEKLTREHPYWLDLQHVAALALEELGEDYAPARETVVGELLALLRRVPELEGLTFASGVPFVGPEAKAWLQSQQGSGEGSGGAAAAGPEGDGADEDSLPAVERRAREMAGAGKVAEALRLFQDATQRLQARGDRFRWRLRMAELCLEWGHAAVAVPMFEELDEDVERFRLSEWDPPLCLGVVRGLLNGYRQLARKQDRPAAGYQQKIAECQDRLCRLDPLAAIELNPPRKSN